MAQAGAVNGQGSCACGEGFVTAQSEVQWMGLETLNWGAGTLVTAAMEAGHLKERRRQ